MAVVRSPGICSECGSKSFTQIKTPIIFSEELHAFAFSCDDCGTLVLKQPK